MGLDIVIAGLSITSSWGNGHATTYRALVNALHQRGHSVLFLERDAEWYAANRDLPSPSFCRTVVYHDVAELNQFAAHVKRADLVIIGSYVPEGIEVAEWLLQHAEGVTAFYDIDTPITLEGLANDSVAYINRELIPRFDLYFSFTGGPTLERIERELGAQSAHALYCSADPNAYYPGRAPKRWNLGYMGTYSADRQEMVERLLLGVAKRFPAGTFVVVGPTYPETIVWPANVERVIHLAPEHHREFYNSQGLTLNVTRSAMTAVGYSPSVRLFEAAACATPVVTDLWPGLEEFFEPGREILVAETMAESLHYARDLTAAELRTLGDAAWRRYLQQHTPTHRARELEQLVKAARGRRTFPQATPIPSAR